MEDDPARRSPHVLREYALVADGERGALIGPQGDVAWMCAPGWADDAVFAGLLGAAGDYVVRPECRFVWGGYYERGSLIWRSRWISENGIVECREALALPAHTGRAVLLRRIEALEGAVPMSVVLAPHAGFGAEPLEDLHRDDDGCWSARTGALRMRWSGAPDARVVETGAGSPEWRVAFTAEPGEPRDLVLELGTSVGEDPLDPERLWRQTETGWSDAVPALEHTAAPRDAAHAVAVLRGMTSAHGGMVAAATTALPERAEAGRNYDYRYVWVRDQCYAGQAAAAAGLDDLLDDAVRFLGARLLEDGPRLMPAYTTTGGTVPPEREIDVPGYPGGGRSIGNHVRSQFQLDAFGELLLLFAAAARRDRLDAEGWRAVNTAVEAVAKRWQDTDGGVWELDDRAWTHSRLICAAGLRAVAAVEDAHRVAGPAAEWSALADRIVADTASRALHPSGRWQRAADDSRHDGALLLPALRGALPPEDPRSVLTWRTYIDDLTADGYAYRFRHDPRPLGDAEGAFLLCGFYLAMACRQQGDPVGANHWFERGRSACGPPGLFSEEFDVTQRQLRGNLPQAFVHAVLLESAVALGE